MESPNSRPPRPPGRATVQRHARAPVSSVAAAVAWALRLLSWV